MELKGLTVLALMVMVLCAYALVAPAVAQPTPFMIYGHVYYENGTMCNGSVVNITNWNTSEQWQATTNASYNYYQLILANGTDLNASEILRFNVTDESQSKIFNHTVTSEEVNYGGILNSNVTLSVPSQQTWYFTNTEASTPIYVGATYNKTMTKGAEGGNDKITLEPGQRVWFYADQVAQCNVTFPAGEWNVVYWVKALNTTESNTRLYTRLQNVTPSGGYTKIEEGYNLISYSGNIQENVEPLDARSFTIPEGGKFAIEVLWQNTASGNLEIYCNPLDKPSSQVTSPSSDPGYPVPELPTLILFSAGLIILAGYVVLKRRK